jgi:cytochrome c nitrite reductase small subunit
MAWAILAVMRMGWEAWSGLVVAAAIGLAVGVGGFTFVYARGASYLTNDPAACANCHVMREHYAGWLASSHRAVAACNDCHTPPGAVGKYLTKASNGWWHSVAFTTGRFPEPIRITPRNRAVTEQACRACHRDVVEAIAAPSGGAGPACARCHAAVGHLR